MTHYVVHNIIHEAPTPSASILALFWPTVIAYGAGVIGVRLNLTGSAPVGLYIVSNASGAFVEFCPPTNWGALSVERGYRRASGRCLDQGEPLLKPIVANPGDLVEVTATGVSVNGMLIPNS